MADYVKEIRQLVGHRPIFLCGAGVIILNERNEILLQRRVDTDEWAWPGGSMELGETMEQAAIREAYEETGLTVRNLEFFRMYSGPEIYLRYPNGDEVFWVTSVFVCRDFAGEIRPDHVESKDCRFFALDALPEKLFRIDGIGIRDYIASLKQGTL